MALKHISSIFFGITFLMALVLFADIGTSYISKNNAKLIFLSCGAIAMFLNFLNFKNTKSNPTFNFIYWLGSMIAFLGLVFQIFQWPYGQFIMIGGFATITASYFYNPSKHLNELESDELLDSPNTRDVREI